MLKKVDFPQPVLPTMATISPRLTVKSSRSMATTAVPDPFCRKTLRSARTWMSINVGGSDAAPPRHPPPTPHAPCSLTPALSTAAPPTPLLPDTPHRHPTRPVRSRPRFPGRRQRRRSSPTPPTDTPRVLFAHARAFQGGASDAAPPRH